MNTFNLLDCTLRDGGYYNNWDFSKKAIQEYLYAVESSNIKFIELGFRFNDKIKNKGLTAYTDNKLINKLKISDKTNIGIMINASDYIVSGKIDLEKLRKVIPKNISKKVKFIRVACHHAEVMMLNNFFKYIESFKLKIFINIMQISEINNKQISKISSYLSNKKCVSVLYLADSLGALKPNKLKRLLINFKKKWKREIGLHAHDNLNLALKNSLFGVNNGISWIDSTITGMGRGPGNLKTEKIIPHSKKIKKTKKFSKVLKDFKKLKKIYKWGSNIYYEKAANKKIHPTYIQKILNDQRYKKSEYNKIINQLGTLNTSKYNPYKLINSAYFISNKPKGTFCPEGILKNKDILILGSGKNLLNNYKKIEKIIEKKKLFVICLNTLQNINEKYIGMRVACHPFRIMSDKKKYKQFNSNIVVPYSMLIKKLRKSIDLKKNYFHDYGLKLNTQNKIIIKKNFCSLPFPLAIGYALSIIVAGKAKSVKVAGFDGYDRSDSNQDDTSEIFKYFIVKYFKSTIISLTKTNYDSLRYHNLSVRS